MKLLFQLWVLPFCKVVTWVLPFRELVERLMFSETRNPPSFQISTFQLVFRKPEYPVNPLDNLIIKHLLVNWTLSLSQ